MPISFFKEFTRYKVIFLVNFFSSYNQLELNIESKNLIAFTALLKLLQQITVPIGGTNSVTWFIKTITKILKHHIPHYTLPFLDDITVKGP